MDARYINLNPYTASTEFRYLSIRKHIYYDHSTISINKGSLLDLSIGFDVVYLPFMYDNYNVRVSMGFPDLNKSGTQR